MGNGIRAQLVAYTFLLTLIVGAGIGGHSLYTSHAQMRQNFQHQGIALATILSESLVEPLYQLRIGDARQLLAAARRSPGIRSAVAMDTKGRVLTDGTRENPQRFRRHQPTVEVLGQVLESTTPLVRAKKNVICIIRSVAPPGGRPVGLLQLELDLAEAEAAFQRATRNEALFILLILGLGALVAILISRRLVSPIVAMSEGARAIGSGRLDHRIQIRRNDELGQLAKSINEMAADLAATTVSKDFFDGVIRALPTYLLVLDADSRIRFANAALLNAAGCGESEFFGVHVNTLLGRPDGEAIDVTNSCNEARGVEATLRLGGVRQVPVACRWSVIRDSRGGIEQVVFIAEDLSEIKAARAERERFFSVSPDLICVSDRDGFVRHTNEAWSTLLGIDEENLKARPLLELVHPDDRSATLAQFMRTLDGQTVRSFENRLKTAAGEWRWFSWNTAADPGFETLYASGRDITERRRMEEALIAAKDRALAADRAKSAFLANMSHELRTPLNAIIGYSEMLEEDAAEEGRDGLVEDLRKIHGSGRHLLALINDVLDLSKVEAGRMQISSQNFDVAGAVADMADTVRPLMEKNGNVLEVRCAADCGSMRSDLTRLRQILLNLLSNAAKFTHGGHVTMTVEREREDIRFDMEDTGIGIEAEALEQIFDPFAQGDATTTRDYGGTGLGLTISRRLCELLGGEISARSTPGEGSRFSVTIPAVLAEEQEPAAAAPAAVDGEPEDAELVLVIDDDAASRELISTWLTERGYRVATARGGAEGLELAREMKPAMITLDVYMPDTDGWSVLRSLKSDPDLSGIPVVMCTMTDQRQLAQALGAADYLVKPIDRQQLARAVARRHMDAAAGHALVVEDDTATRSLVARSLSRAGWKVSQAADGEEALEQLSKERPDAILLDLMMPQVDGFEVIETLRSTPAWAHIPVVVFTAMELGESESARLDGQVHKVLRKGEYDGSALVDAVNGAASKKDAAA